MGSYNKVTLARFYRVVDNLRYPLIQSHRTKSKVLISIEFAVDAASSLKELVVPEE